MEMTQLPKWNAMKKIGIIVPVYGANEENCYIDSDAEIGCGTTIWPGVTIGKFVKIGTLSEIGKGATIIGKIKIGKNVNIGHHVEISGEGYVGDNCKVNGDIKNPRMKKNCKILTSA